MVHAWWVRRYKIQSCYWLDIVENTKSKCTGSGSAFKIAEAVSSEGACAGVVLLNIGQGMAAEAEDMVAVNFYLLLLTLAVLHPAHLLQHFPALRDVQNVLS